MIVSDLSKTLPAFHRCLDLTLPLWASKRALKVRAWIEIPKPAHHFPRQKSCGWCPHPVADGSFIKGLLNVLRPVSLALFRILFGIVRLNRDHGCEKLQLMEDGDLYLLETAWLGLPRIARTNSPSLSFQSHFCVSGVIWTK
jgi:hypothetical protein